MPRSWRVRLSGEAGQHRTAAFGAAYVASPLELDGRMTSDDKVNILLVDDQPSKLLTYEVILRELGDNIIRTSSGKEALEQLLRNEIAVVLMDVCMPELDGFELASMI